MTIDLHQREKIYEYLKKYDDNFYVNEIYLMIEANNGEKSTFKIQNFLVTEVVFVISIFLSGTLLFLNLLFEEKFDYNKEIAIARVYREKYKISNVFVGIQFIEDNINKCDFTIYRIGNRFNRLIFLIKSYLKFCIKDFIKIKQLLKNEYLASYNFIVLLWCAKRIPHTVIHNYAIEQILVNYKLRNIYIGTTHERFAIIAQTLTKKYNKRLICIPHGIESTEKMPVGYVGDVFYCSSEEMASKLNILYNTSKFIFDEDITRRMYSIKNNNSNIKINRTKRVVFFTQPTENKSTKSIILYIASYLETKGKKLYIKVHPFEKSSDYKIKNTEIIHELEDAIFNNICISYLSTILLEALYNDSVSVSIVHLVKDNIARDYEFLNDRRILKPKDEITLLKMIDDFI